MGPISIASAILVFAASQALGSPASPAERLDIAWADDDLGFPAFSRPTGGRFFIDPHIAVGPTHLVAVTNEDIAVYDKTGALQTGWPEKFWGAVNFWDDIGVTEAFDPLVFYDSETGRFWVTATKSTANQPPHLVLVAVSETTNPSGAWKKWKVDVSTVPGLDANPYQLDRPNASIHDNEVYISFWGRWCNDPGCAPPGRVQTAFVVLDKNQLMNGPGGVPKPRTAA